MNITPEAAKAVLEKMIEEGTIEEADVRDILLSSPTPTMMRATDLVHTMFCQGEHLDNSLPDYCLYGMEESQDSCWTDDEHQLWLGRTLVLMHDLGVTTDAELASLVNAASPAGSVLYSLKLNNPMAYKLFLYTKGWEKMPWE